MQELTFEEVVEVNGGRLLTAFDIGFSIGEGINWLLARSYSGRGEFPSVPRAGHE